MSGPADINAPKVFTIGASAPFAATLAQGLVARLGDDPLALAGVTIYLPTRRAARGFGEAFAQQLGGAALLPQFRALGDADEDDLLFDAADDIELTPAIAPLRRQLLLAHLVRRWHLRQRGGEIGFAQAAALAARLAAVMDEMETQGADPARIAALAPVAMAEHWQDVQGFLALLQDAWPDVLSAEGAVNPAARRDAALRALARRLAASPPPGLVIAAGSTGSIPATAELLGAIARLPQGALVLPGLDRMLDADSWRDLDPGHPQYGLKQLLDRIGVAREAVRDWHAAPGHDAREHLLSETLRPAPTTDAWRALVEKGGGDIAEGLKGLSVTEAPDPAAEALAIALALRQALDTPGRSAALVTPDRGLARRVAAELKRWDITIDDSAGRPLAHTSAGAFLCLLAEAAAARFAPVPLLALLKHPFARRGEEPAAFRAMARKLDIALRGPRPDPGLGAVTRRLPSGALMDWWRGIAALLAPLEQLFGARDAALSDLIAAHLAAAEALACDGAGEETTCLLWSGSDGEAAAQFLAQLQTAANALPAIEPSAYAPLFRQLAMRQAVRSPVGRHPRLAILGPLEARLQSFDLTILGGLNEGGWPQAAPADPWFSRPMRAAMGLEQPERGIGLSAHDFAMLAAGPQVMLTRARKADGAPTVPSRWLQRLEQLARGLKLEARLAPDEDMAQLAARMMAVTPGERLPRPRPAPPLAVRPRRLTVTEIETWLRDPYAIYAKHVLRLKPLDPLDEEVGPLERGNALHKALEIFIARYPRELPPDAALKLTLIADEVFAQMGIPKAALALWRPRFLSAASWFVDFERARRNGIAESWLEKKGRLVIAMPGGDFELVARADRIDRLTSGSAAILDYKTGALPRKKDTATFLMPQLPLEGAILEAGGFDDVPALRAEELLYVKLSGGADPGEPRWLEDAPELPAAALAKLKNQIARFDDPSTPYPPRVIPRTTDAEGDYDHLARVREWAPSGWEAE